ncbi:MAG: hypothetical protein SWL02_09735 [Pseudomonadota bacterium]|nr:hypothetical protein [Pseudomonadota bacterium]
MVDEVEYQIMDADDESHQADRMRRLFPKKSMNRDVNCQWFEGGWCRNPSGESCKHSIGKIYYGLSCDKAADDKKED